MDLSSNIDVEVKNGLPSPKKLNEFAGIIKKGSTYVEPFFNNLISILLPTTSQI